MVHLLSLLIVVFLKISFYFNLFNLLLMIFFLSLCFLSYPKSMIKPFIMSRTTQQKLTFERMVSLEQLISNLTRIYNGKHDLSMLQKLSSFIFLLERVLHKTITSSPKAFNSNFCLAWWFFFLFTQLKNHISSKKLCVLRHLQNSFAPPQLFAL